MAEDRKDILFKQFDMASKAEKEEFDSAFDETVESDKRGTEDATRTLLLEFTSPVATRLNELFTQVEGKRKSYEDTWQKDLRQYKGEYDPEVLNAIHPKRSKAYFSITRTKVNTVTSRMTDILFPANGEKNWSIQTTPIPELSPEIVQSIALQYQEATGQEITAEEIEEQIDKEADNRCKSMSKEMDDQLSELKYRDMIRNVIKSGNTYGTGIFKGPLVTKDKSKRWLPGPDGEWVTVEIEKLKPYLEFVPLWDFYPDMSVTDIRNARYVFQRHVMPKQKLYKLSKRDDFNGGAIKQYMKAYPDGDYDVKNFETNLRNIKAEDRTDDALTNSIDSSEKYEVKEFWGYMSAEDLMECGVTSIGEEHRGMDFAANIWILGDMVIKVILTPEGIEFPYYIYYYDKDETSIFGEGIPSIMRDAQSLFNASIRAMLDNAALSAGPIIEANMDLLAPNEDPNDLYPFRVFQRYGQGADATSKAIGVYEIPSYTNELLAMVQFFQSSADEITAVPRYMYGDESNMGGAGRTASGLSMLMGAANTTLKDQVKNFDDGVTKPFIKALYNWNMKFNPKPDIKGDFEIVAKGSASLIAKEVRMEQLNQFLMLTNNPVDLAYVQRDNILREVLKVMDLDDLDLIKDKRTVQKEEKFRQIQQMQDQKFMKDLELMKAISGGHMEKLLQEEDPEKVQQILAKAEQEIAQTSQKITG
jgi:hypothetical protein